MRQRPLPASLPSNGVPSRSADATAKTWRHGIQLQADSSPFAGRRNTHIGEAIVAAKTSSFKASLAACTASRGSCQSRRRAPDSECMGYPWTGGAQQRGKPAAQMRHSNLGTQAFKATAPVASSCATSSDEKPNSFNTSAVCSPTKGAMPSRVVGRSSKWMGQPIAR